ncbi:MAG: amino acid adenylation domain-containing protein [Rhodobacter sp.]|nr:amino acid adenylation domain-containing protein [Rhodobacter sp.]
MPRSDTGCDTALVAQATVLSLFAQQVRRNPGAVAVTSMETALSYGQLDQNSDRIARALRNLGVAKGSVVAVSMAKSPEFVTTLLGVLKAGAAYLPINQAWPNARVDAVREIASACITVVDGTTERNLSGGAPIIAVEEALAEQTGHDADLPFDVDITPEDLAYVTFTSGSSGNPKGVMIPHRGITSVVLDQFYADFSPSMVTLQQTAQSFDPMTFEIWGPLLHGGTCAVFDSTVPTIGRMLSSIVEQKVNTVILTPSLFHMIVDDAPEMLMTLDTLLVGGEVMSLTHALKARSIAPDLILHNTYGPTEATFIATYFPISEMSPDAANVPLGYALSHRGVHILNQNLAPVETGEIGEICISGPGLALGYIRDEARTAQAFVTTDAIDGTPKRVYRTGDQGRVSDAGLIEFCGRTDTQVQLNGFRIELEEIDANLATHPGVKRAAATLCGEGIGLELCAAVVAHDGLPNDLLAFLSGILPAYMVPQKFVLFDKLPLNPHGKVDRKRITQVIERGR